MRHKFCKEMLGRFLYFFLHDTIILRIHLLACAWGSMKRGHRLEFITRTAFSMDHPWANHSCANFLSPFDCRELILGCSLGCEEHLYRERCTRSPGDFGDKYPWRVLGTQSRLQTRWKLLIQRNHVKSILFCCWNRQSYYGHSIKLLHEALSNSCESNSKQSSPMNRTKILCYFQLD